MIDCQPSELFSTGASRRRLRSIGPSVVLLLCACASGPTQSTAQSSPSGVGGTVVFADADAQSWTIGNNSIRVMFRLTAANDLVLDRIFEPTTGRVFNSSTGPDSAVTVNGVSAPLGVSTAGWTLVDSAMSETTAGVRLAFTFRSSRAGLTVVRTYACYSDSPTVEAWTTFRATGNASVSVSDVSVWQLVMPGTTVHYVLGLRNDTPGSPVEDAFAVQSAVLGQGQQLLLREADRSTETYLPMVAADTRSDEFFGGLLWSGSWQIVAQGLGGTIRATATLPGTTFVVDATRPIETPHGFFGFTPGGRGDVSEALRTFIARGIRDGREYQPLVTYNTWFAYGTEIDEPTIRDEMIGAASLGVELFVVDAGWYLGVGVGSDFDSGLGSWEIDPGRFPNGLAVLRAEAHELGMQFGLWVEPERVDLRTVDRPGLVREAWLTKNDGSYRAARTAQVCLASPAARQWLLDKLMHLLDEVQPDYLKWDNNLWVNCNRSGHGHGTTDGNYAHVAGLYEVLAALRARYPTMLIENCSQGGNRLDLGMMRYTDTAWMDDRTGPAVHVRHNLQGLMTFLPPAYLLSFVVENAGEPLIEPPDLPLYMQSRMPGILGLTYRVADLGESDRDGIARQITLYKKIRETLRHASGRVLTAQAAPGAGPPWDGVQVLSGTSGDAVVFAFQNDPAVPSVTLRPERLDERALYVITRADGTPMDTADGATLMTDGIEFEASPESSAHVLLLQKTQMAAAVPVAGR